MQRGQGPILCREEHILPVDLVYKQAAWLEKLQSGLGQEHYTRSCLQ